MELGQIWYSMTQQAERQDGQKFSTAKRIEQVLLEEISVGRLGPGQRLDEVGLAKRFGASRTPVREALSRLTAQGVLVQGERRGTFVAEYSREELSQIFEAMHEIETACARIASQRLSLFSRAEIEAAQVACEAAADAGDNAAYLQANEEFHLTIYRATGNPFMAEIALEFRRRTGPFRAKKFVSPEGLKASAQSHRELIANIFSEDSATASKGMRDHMTASFLEALKLN
jgi:DNA-binding GntR family transcriptional regulator